MIPETYVRLLSTIDDARERLDAAQELAFQMELDDPFGSVLHRQLGGVAQNRKIVSSFAGRGAARPANSSIRTYEEETCRAAGARSSYSTEMSSFDRSGRRTIAMIPRIEQTRM